MFTAVLRITGAGRLADFRERVRALMVRDPDAENYEDKLENGVLEYRFAPRIGIPFPAFAEASREFPELQVEAEWDHDGVRGRALIENGKLVEQTPGLADDALVEVAVEDDGRLVLALVCSRKAEDALIGYAATSEKHTYFRFARGALELVDADRPDEALETLAFGFVEEWIWFDEEDAALERARYANYGYPVRGANVRSEKLALLRCAGMRHSSLDALAIEARDALRSKWLNPT